MKKIIKKNLANIVTAIGILTGLLACILAIRGGSWAIAEILFLISIITDGADGKIARKFGSTSWGPYLDDIADFINFWVHPGLWIWIVSDIWWLGAVYTICILARLVRFTLYKQDAATIFSGLPSPAAALGMFGIIFLRPEEQTLITGTLLFSFLAISQIRFMHVMKYQKINALRCPLAAVIIFLPILFGYHEVWMAITHLTIIWVYILFSLIFLAPHYARR